MRSASQRTGSLLTLTAAAAALAATLFPLGTYAVTLAALGLVHVAVELRYVDARFSGRVPWRLGSLLLVMLGAIVFVRLLGIGGVLARSTETRIELLLVASLVAATLPLLLRAGKARAALGTLLLFAVLYGAIRAPLLTIVLFAVAHNLTPLGFVADALEGRARRWALALGGLLFVLVPALMASGLLARWLGGAHLGPWTLPAAGALGDNLGAFVPGPLLDHPHAVDFFSAAVYLQCMHYAVVIHVLPRLGLAAAAEPMRLPWPTKRIFNVALAALAILSFAAFAWTFRDTRILYGLFALVHAWIEIPLLLLATALRPQV